MVLEDLQTSQARPPSDGTCVGAKRARAAGLGRGTEAGGGGGRGTLPSSTALRSLDFLSQSARE
eukprot:4483404-Pyramimonas_sp.AAC.1